MADLNKYVQMQPKQIGGAGAILGATTVIVKDLTGIDGVELTMSDFGDKGFATLEPGSGTQEEQISFTGITQNGNGTATLTGVKTVLFISPYTETSGLAKTHAGGTVFVISNTAGFYDRLASKYNDETITGIWTFTDPNVPRMDSNPAYGAGTELYFATKQYVDDTAFNGAPDASTTQKGIVQEATLDEILAGTETGDTGAELFINPGVFGPRTYAGYAVDEEASDDYVITLSPPPTSYEDGMIVQFKANTTNTGACTIDINTLGAQSLKMNKDLDPVDGYIKAGQVVTIVYDGTNFQILSVSGKPSVSQTGEEIYAVDSVGTDSYSITLNPEPVDYIEGMTIRFKAGATNTGSATLDVNGLGAVDIKKDVNSDLSNGDILVNQIVEVIYDGANFQLISTVSDNVIPTQVIPYYSGTATTSGSVFRCTSDYDGSSVFFIFQTSSTSLTIQRLAKQSSTGQYIITNQTTLAITASFTEASAAVIGNYLYLQVNHNSGSTKIVNRYDKADLANVTSMTISGTVWSAGGGAFGDGSNLYIFESTDTYRKYSISGTTITNVGTVSFTSLGRPDNGGAISDNSSVYMITVTTNDITVREFDFTGGAQTAQSGTYYFYNNAYPNPNGGNASLKMIMYKAGIVGALGAHTTESNAAVTGAEVTINYIGTP